MRETHERVADYRDHVIWLRRPGFEFTPVMLGKIASFIVRGPDDTVAVFAFMYSLLDYLDGPPANEAQLLDEARRVIEAAIEAHPLPHQHEATYEYRDGAWTPVTAPRWWISLYR